MLNLATVSLDPTKAQEGQWFDFYSGSRLKIASSDSPLYKGYLARLAKEHRVELDDMNDDQFGIVNDITCKSLARFVLIGWEGIAVGGKEVPYSERLAVDILKNSPKIYDFVTAKSSDLSKFNQAAVEQAKKF